ncbi:MAG TPA: hypothetical protein VJV75_08700 [Candidatus Polarisedimenticolia bacterium]|nr:hypothetical protein [Candidatus Polarisedimenticolia bacterium]
MINTAPGGPRKMNPEALGPLGDRPLAQATGKSNPADFFPGASGFLSAGQQKKRQAQWTAVRPLADRLLKADEQLLYVAHAMQVPSLWHSMALGAYALPFHQVVLYFTDTRMIEVMLDLRGKNAGTRIRSFPWSGVKDLKMGWGRFNLTPAKGKKMGWRVPLRGDRRLLDLLIARIKTRLMTEGAAHAAMVPLWHCPKCVAVVPSEPESCAACRTTFTSGKFASILSIAFPGAGLLYAGYPWLAVMDFLGELMLFALFVMLLLQAGPGELVAPLVFGGIMFVLTKMQSIRLSRILTARSRPDSEAHRSGFGKFAMVGGIASVVLIGGSLPLMGAARPRLDRDLDHPMADEAWTGSRDRSTWSAFAKDGSARSQWSHPDGLKITLFAYPQSFMDTPGDLHTELRNQFGRDGTMLTADDENVPAPFQGFRMITVVAGPSGEPVAVINYFVVDSENHDVHQAVAAVVEKDATIAEGMVRDFLSEATFVPAIAPTGSAAPAAEAGNTGNAPPAEAPAAPAAN